MCACICEPNIKQTLSVRQSYSNAGCCSRCVSQFNSFVRTVSQSWLAWDSWYLGSWSQKGYIESYGETEFFTARTIAILFLASSSTFHSILSKFKIIAISWKTIIFFLCKHLVIEDWQVIFKDTIMILIICIRIVRHYSLWVFNLFTNFDFLWHIFSCKICLLQQFLFLIIKLIVFSQKAIAECVRKKIKRKIVTETSIK